MFFYLRALKSYGVERNVETLAFVLSEDARMLNCVCVWKREGGVSISSTSRGIKFLLLNSVHFSSWFLQ